MQRETIYREIYIFKLILKDLFLSLQPHPAAQGAGREWADPLPSAGLPTGGSRSLGAQTWFMPPLHGQLIPSNMLVCASVSPVARMERLEIMDVPQWRKGACCSPAHRQGFGRGRSLEWSLLCQAPELSHDHSPCVTLVLCPGDGTGLSTHRALHADVGSHGATRHILLGNGISYHVPVQRGCPCSQPLSPSPSRAPSAPLPSTLTPAVFAVPAAPGPPTLPLSRGGLGDPVPVPGVGTAGSSPPPPQTRHLSYLYQREQRFIFVVCTGGSGD